MISLLRARTAPFRRPAAPARRGRPNRPAAVLLVALALLPLLYIGSRAFDAGSNVAYWDEFETALALVLRLNAGMSPTAFLDELFAVNNEHRMVTSRLLFATSYWLTGTVNFSVVSLVGNAALVALCALLVLRAGSASRRLQLGVILAFVLFQLENYENFLWSGSSIDHFQVLLFVGAMVTALAQGTRPLAFVAGLCALLATLTLAHGLLAWPLGAALLWHAGRQRHLLGWSLLASLVTLGYAAGFSFNGAHRFAGLTANGALEIVHYWLTLLGSVPALGRDALAPWLGAGLLAVLAWLSLHRTPRREPLAFPLAWYGVAALALVAVGRAEQVGGLVMSRYVILSSLTWGLTAFMALARYSHPRRPLAALAWSLPILGAFNLTANRVFADKADAWLECRDIAVSRFKQHGADGRGDFSLYPQPARSTQLLHEAERRGVYRLGPLCLPRSFPAAQPSSRINYCVDELTISERSAFVRGWAAIPGVRSVRGDLHLVLRSAHTTLVYTTVNTQRPDVAAAFHNPDWQRSGFLFARRRDTLPPGDYQLGFLVKDGGRTEYIMTDHHLKLDAETGALLAAVP